jgi:hypothetical protein
MIRSLFIGIMSISANLSASVGTDLYFSGEGLSSGSVIVFILIILGAIYFNLKNG